MKLRGIQVNRAMRPIESIEPGYRRLARELGRLSCYGICAVLIISCSNFAGPEYKRPEIPVKEEWSQSQEMEVSAVETIRPDWWTGFGDSYLDELIQRSIANNSDLKILAARIDSAGAGIKSEKARALPSLSATASRQNTLLVGDGPDAPGLPPGAPPPPPGAPAPPALDRTQTENRLGASLRWELDIWGKLQKGVNASKARYRAAEWEWRAGYLTLVSDVASRYFLIRQLDEQIQQQRQTQENNIKLLKIYEAQLKEGLVAESQVLSQKAELASLTQQLEDLNRQRQVTTFNLATLLGVPAGDLVVPVAPLTKTVQVMEVPSGLPSDLLSRRPDIIAQEYQVLSAHELVGQARLAKLPSIELSSSANASGASKALSTLIKTWTFGIGPNINIPIFDPNVNARLKTNEASAKVAEEQYRKTVMTAFEEVEVSLTNLASRKKQKQVLENQIKHLSIVRDVQYAQLKEGLVSQLQVFDTDRQLLAAQLAQLQTHQQILSDTVTLYKALGGGWSVDSVEQAEL